MSGLSNISAIVLAAGASKRMGQNKLLMEFRGRPMLSHTLELVSSLPFGQKLLVTSHETASAIQIPDGFAVLYNDKPQLGQAESVRIGITAAVCDFYMFFAGDMPLLGAETVMAVANAAEPGRIAVPCAKDGVSGPAVFSKVFCGELRALSGDTGGRGVIRAHPQLCKRVPLDSPVPLSDIDTPQDFERLNDRKL